MTDSADLTLAHQLADQADEIARRYFRAPDLGAEDKGDGSPVTNVDREIECVLRASIRTEHPGDAFVGEEFGAHGRSSRRWITTPLTARRASLPAIRNGALSSPGKNTAP
ncbi:inositol monophosphatase family protein [Streptomyces sp. NPDC006333]|uniref:inositol monophosphatase family protein n=1 Tax=Streptomyces sp. NPDC006333 TaxID=3156753 RepID=UPI0033B5C9BE